MRSIKKIFFVIIGIICIINLTGCGEKKKLTAEDFKTKMENKKYIVNENSTDSYKYLKSSYTATSNTTVCKFSFYEMTDVDHAIYFFDNNKKNLEENSNDTKNKSSNNFANYNQYTLETDSRYSLISRVGTTVLYANNENTCKKEVDNIVKYLGY